MIGYCHLFFGTIAAADVVVKQLPDVTTDVPNATGGFVSREVSKVRGYYRDEKLVLLEYRTKLTLNTGKGQRTSDYVNYFVMANERRIIEVGGPHLAPSSVTSPWPIRVHRVGGTIGNVQYSICIPDINFFEYIEFRNGELIPLIDGEKFVTLRAANFEMTRDALEAKQ